MEEQKGIIARFVFRRSANSGDSLDRDIDSEKKQTNDFSILEDHVKAPEELPKKTKLFFALAAEKWDADFYAKVNDDVYVNIGEFLYVEVGSLNLRVSYGAITEQLLQVDLADLFFLLMRMMILALDLDVKHIHEEKFCCSSWGYLCVQAYDLFNLFKETKFNMLER